MAAKVKITDWPAIEDEYRTGQLSMAEIGRRHGITRGAIWNRATRADPPWARDLVDAVKARIRRKLSTDVDNVDAVNGNDEDLIEAASDRGAQVVRLHRQDIASLRELETALLKELKENPTKLYIAQYQGKIIKKVVGLTAAERALAANNLANVQHKRIQLERQAYSLDAGAGDENMPDTIQITYHKIKPPKDD